MIVLKFGGTSVEDARAMRTVFGIVRAVIARKPLVVLSACAGVTNMLLDVARTAGRGDADAALALAGACEERHLGIVRELLADSPARARLEERVLALTDELRRLVRGVAILGECTPRSLDAIAAFGERLSTAIFAEFAEESDVECALLDVRTVMVTDDHFTEATPLVDAIARRCAKHLVPLFDRSKMVVTQGFIGATDDGTTTTIGRGGSDYSAALLGVASGAEEIQIWTDVDGMMTADPRLVPTAQIQPVMSFAEASELAYFGAKVLHPKTILPAIEREIPVRVLNSKNPSAPGTVIVRRLEGDGKGVTSIASKRHITLLDVSSERMVLAHDFFKMVFDVLERYETVVHTIASTEMSLSMTLDDLSHLEDIRAELERFARVAITHNNAIVCCVGEVLRPTPGIVGRIFTALSRVNVRMISQGASETSVSFVVSEDDAAAAVRAVHREFFE